MKLGLKLIFCLFFLFLGCEEAVDDLWDSNDDILSESSVLLGDWYAESIIQFPNADCKSDPVDYMTEEDIVEYNIWLQEDSLFDLSIKEDVILEDFCISYLEGVWSDNGCFSDYYNDTLTPLSICSVLGYNIYNAETTSCSQTISTSGSYIISNSPDSTLTLNYTPICESSDGFITRYTNQADCETSDNIWNQSKIESFSYNVDINGDIELSIIDSDTCKTIYLYNNE